MFRYLFKKKEVPDVTFATSCWESDWKKILLDTSYLQQYQIANHNFPFKEKLLIINNVKDLAQVQKMSSKKVEEGILTKVFLAEKRSQEVLKFFQLKKEDFKATDKNYPEIGDEWLYFNALAPLSAIFACKTPYLLYMTGDSFLPKKVDWIEKAIFKMEKNPKFKVANLVWNENYLEAKKESYRKIRDFFISSFGFSDQMFLVKIQDFQKPMYREIRKDSHHFPRGDVFEKRVFSYLKNRGFERLIFRHGSYTHENI